MKIKHTNFEGKTYELNVTDSDTCYSCDYYEAYAIDEVAHEENCEFFGWLNFNDESDPIKNDDCRKAYEEAKDED